MNSLPQNPFTRPAFWGRQYELRTIYSRLLTQPPQCCAVIGETSFGKTTLLGHLSGLHGSAGLSSLEIQDKFTFVFLDCALYTELDEMGNYASAKFWWDLYSQLWLKLHPQNQLSIAKPKVKAEDSVAAFEIKSELEDLIRQQPPFATVEPFLRSYLLRTDERGRGRRLHFSGRKIRKLLVTGRYRVHQKDSRSPS